jgi:tripartite-type tricarboxylate transporter receptor subunit TctC
MRKIVFTVSLVTILSLFGTYQADCEGSKEAYPARPIDFVVAASAGAGSDVLSRIIAKHMSEDLGKPINVINKGGGNGIPAVQSVLSAKADGYTLMADQALSSAFQLLLADLPYKVEDRTFICRVAKGPMVLVANPDMPWKNLNDVKEFALRNPGDFTWAGIGGMSAGDLVQLQFFSAAGIDVSKTKQLIYKGGGEILASVAGGHAKFGTSAASGVPSFSQSGKIRPIAVSGSKRVAMLPDVASAAEQGYPTVDLGFWVGLTGPAALPAEIVATLNASVKRIIEKDAFKADLEKFGVVIEYLGPSELKDSVFKEAEDVKKLKGLK